MSQSAVIASGQPADLKNIYVRCQGVDNEYVVVSPTDLPSNPYDLVSLLKVETAPRSCWRDVAAAYFRAGKWPAGITVLEQATSDDVENLLSGLDDDPSARSGPPCSRIDLLAALSGAHVMMADSSAHDAPARADALRKAADVLSRADKIDLDDPSIWAARGWAEFHAAKSSAANWLDNAKDKNVVLGAIGLAALQLNRSKPPEASRRESPVTLLISALRSDVCPPGVWTGLAYALYKEGRFRDVRNIARRALAALRRSPPPERLEALYLLALVELVDKNSTSVENMTLALQEAYTTCGGNHDARILSLLANMHFQGGDFENAEQFAQRAVSAASKLPSLSVGAMFGFIHNSVQVDSLFQLARAQHHLGKNEDAMSGFEQIKNICASPECQHVKVNPGVFLRLGLLKLSTGRKADESLAKECLEKVLKGCNDRCGVASRALGVIIGREVLQTLRRSRPRGGELYDRAVSLLRKGLDENTEAKNDVPAQLVYAALVEETYPRRAMTAYKKVIEILEERDEEVDPEIWNNYSSILARNGELEEAHEVSTSKITEEYASECLTVIYNRARITELLGRHPEAEKMYRTIPKGPSPYAEAITRIAVMKMNSPDGYKEAEKLLQEARESSSTRPSAAIHLSRLYSIQKQYKLAQDVLEQTAPESDFVTLSFASFMHRFLDGLDEQRRQRFLIKHIGSQLQKVLTKNRHNASAANGIGVFYAESEMFAEARDALQRAGSGAPNADKVTRVNMAIVQILIGKRELHSCQKQHGRLTPHVRTAARSLFEQADKLFSDALELTKLTNPNGETTAYCELLLYSAWAQFESEEYRKSADTLTKLVHIMPHSYMTWFNLGVALMESAMKRITRGNNRLETIATAKAELEGARAALQKHNMWKKPPSDPLTKSYIRSAFVKDMEKYIWLEIKSQDVSLRNARMQEEDRVAKQEARVEEVKKIEERRRAQVQRVEDEKRKKEEELRQAFFDSERRRKENEENHRRMMAEKTAVYEDDDMGDEDGAQPKKSSKRKKKAKQEDFDDSDGEAGPDTPRKRKRKSPSSEDKTRKKPKKDSNDSGSEYSDAAGDDNNDAGPHEQNGDTDRNGDAKMSGDEMDTENANGDSNGVDAGSVGGEGNIDGDSVENGTEQSARRRKRIITDDADDE